MAVQSQAPEAPGASADPGWSRGERATHQKCPPRDPSDFVACVLPAKAATFSTPVTGRVKLSNSTGGGGKSPRVPVPNREVVYTGSMTNKPEWQSQRQGDLTSSPSGRGKVLSKMAAAEHLERAQGEELNVCCVGVQLVSISGSTAAEQLAATESRTTQTSRRGE